MAGTSLLALLDDIASALDDIAVLAKVATKKSAGVLSDDLALNAQQVAGVSAQRELAIVYSVAKGSALNKVILVPLALIVSAISTKLVTFFLILGGLFLCFEGFEKILEKLKSKSNKSHTPKSLELLDTEISIHSFEKQKIKGAVKTDFILSAEIIVITLGTLSQETLFNRFAVLSVVSLIMTLGVYGLVAIIVKLDDIGLYLCKNQKKGLKFFVGISLVKFAPVLMRFLGVAGTAAMFLVGGGILTHNLDYLHHFKESFGSLLNIGFDLSVGILSGAFVVGVVHIIQRLRLARI